MQSCTFWLVSVAIVVSYMGGFWPPRSHEWGLNTEVFRTHNESIDLIVFGSYFAHGWLLLQPGSHPLPAIEPDPLRQGLVQKKRCGEDQTHGVLHHCQVRDVHLCGVCTLHSSLLPFECFIIYFL